MNLRNDRLTWAALCSTLLLVTPSCGGGGGAPSPIVPPNEVEISASASRLTADPASTLLADGTTESVITVEVIDTDGDPVPGATVTLAVTGTGNTVTQPAAPTNDTGIAMGRLATTVAEPKTVTVRVTFIDQDVQLDQSATVEFISPVEPELLGSARFEDSDRDGTTNAGDRLVLGFTLDVDVTNASLGSFDLPVNGDTFGTGAAIQAGPQANEVTILLGDGAVLRSRGTFDAGNLTANQPSGVSVIANSGIEHTDSGQAALAGTADVSPEFAPDAIAIPVANAQAAAAGDLDRDGNLDVWIARDGADQLMLGDGNLGFTAGSTFGNATSTDVVITEFNRFGGVDVVVAQQNGIQTYINRSAGGNVNVAADSLLPTPNATLIRAVDLDADGYPDILAGTATNGVRAWQKRRAIGMTFDDRGSIGAGNVTAIATGDFDRDGHTDVVVATVGNAPQIFDHDGNFGFAAGTQLATNADATDMAAVDVDNDGHTDLIVAQSTGNVMLFRGPTFSAEDAGFTAERLAVGDADGDGFADVAATNGTDVRTYANDGTGAFEATGARVTEPNGILEVALVDLDKEGDLDLMTVANSRAAVRNGSRTGTWGTASYAETAQLGAEDTLATAVADFDADGDLDMIACNSGPDLILFNDGTGEFTYSGNPEHTLGTQVTSSVAVGDIDGDGDIDIVTGGPGSLGVLNRVWENNGAGGFSSAFTFGGTLNALSMALGDLDGDLDLDLVIGHDGANEVWRNDTANGGIQLTFRRSQLPADPVNNNQQTNAVVLRDMDRDGDLDLIVGNGQITSGQQNKYHSNNGSGTLTFLRNLPGGAESTFSLAVANLDGQLGDDIAVGNRGNGVVNQNRIVRGIGNGQFFSQLTPFSDGAHDTRGLAAADIDGDGDLDLLSADIGSRSFRAWINDGAANMTVGDRIGTSNSSALATGDLDADGDTDAIVGHRLNQPNAVYKNQ